MIDPDVQRQFRDRFNPEGSDLRKMQLRMLEMLKYVDSICRENNIKYWLSSGTCLGAVRHGGFIPWDDDVDIELEKKDFKRLIKILQKDDRYFLQSHSTDNEYYAPYVKLRDKESYLKERHSHDIHYKNHGIYIDIFCIEPSSSYLLSRISGTLQCRLLYPLSSIKNKSLRNILSTGIIFPLHKILFPLISSLSKINSRGWYRHIPGSAFYKRRFRDDFQTVKYIPFEDISLPVPCNAAGYLEKIYGDYNSLPPLESIVPHIKKVNFV